MLSFISVLNNVFLTCKIFNEFSSSSSVNAEISYEDLKALLGKSQDLLLVDVRSKEEVDKGRIPGSIHIHGKLI